jgi:hypothetical protein
MAPTAATTTPRTLVDLLALAMVGWMALALAACSGKPDDAHPFSADVTVDASSTLTLSGTVAAGAPLVGTLEVKDSKGATKQALVDDDGHYQLGLKGLTFPLLLRASGVVGGRRVVLCSAATSTDAGGTVNVTPLTDLIVAKVATQAAEDFYAQPDYTRLTDAYLDEARVMVTQHLAPVMDELTDQSLDLRRTAFAADHTGLDAVLDVVEVDVDPEARTALIRDIVNGSSVLDDLTRMQDHTPLPTPPSGSYTQSVAMLAAIDAVLATLNARFAAAVPAATDAALLALFDSDFLHAGASLADFLSSTQLLSSGNVGIKLFNPVILSRASDGLSVRVAVQVRDTLGNVIPYDRVDSDELLFRLGSDGQWRIAGDRRLGDVAITAINHLHWAGSLATSQRALEFWAPSAASAVRYIGFSGPGLPQGTSVPGVGTASGVLLSRASSTSAFGLLDTDGQALGTSWLLACPASGQSACLDVSAMPVRAAYTITFYDTQLQPLGEVSSLVVPRPPVAEALALAQASAWFATPGSTSPASFQALADATSVLAQWTLPGASTHLASGAALSSGTQAMAVLVDGGSSATLGTWAGAAPASAPLWWTEVEGPHDLRFVASTFYAAEASP